jgi:hypothetical protein
MIIPYIKTRDDLEALIAKAVARACVDQASPSTLCRSSSGAETTKEPEGWHRPEDFGDALAYTMIGLDWGRKVKDDHERGNHTEDHQ